MLLDHRREVTPGPLLKRDKTRPLIGRSGKRCLPTVNRDTPSKSRLQVKVVIQTTMPGRTTGSSGLPWEIVNQHLDQAAAETTHQVDGQAPRPALCRWRQLSRSPSERVRVTTPKGSTAPLNARSDWTNVRFGSRYDENAWSRSHQVRRVHQRRLRRRRLRPGTRRPSTRPTWR